MQHMDNSNWVMTLIGADSLREAGRKIGASSSTISRQLERGKLQPETVIALCRAYGRSPVDGLVETGYLTVEDTASKASTSMALRRYSIEERWNSIADEVNGASTRVVVGGLPRFEEIGIDFVGPPIDIPGKDSPPGGGSVDKPASKKEAGR